jgi:hypothetical protein
MGMSVASDQWHQIKARLIFCLAHLLPPLAALILWILRPELLASKLIYLNQTVESTNYGAETPWAPANIQNHPEACQSSPISRLLQYGTLFYTGPTFW